MKRRSPLVWIGSLLATVVVVVAAGGAYLAARPDAWWRDLITDTLSQSLGRQVEIRGAFRLDLGRRLTAEAESIRIANPDWAESGDLLRVGELLLELDVLSVLADTLVIHRLELTDVQAVVEQQRDGETNWTLATGIDAGPPPASESDESPALPVLVEHLAIRELTLRSVIPARWERPLVLEVQQLSGGQRPGDEAFAEGRGRLGDLPFSIEASLSKLSDALRGGPVSYELSGTLGETHLTSQGTVESFTPPLRPKLELTYTGPDIARVTQALGAPLVAQGPFEVRLDLAPDGRGLRGNVDARLGKLELRADLSATDLTSAADMQATMGLTGENLAAIADLTGLPPLPGQAFEIGAAMRRDGGITRLETLTARVGEHRLSIDGVIGAWPALAGTRLTLEAEGPDLAVFTPTVADIGLGRLPSGAYAVSTRIESDRTGIRVAPSEVKVADYRATARGRITTGNTVRAELDVTGAGPDLSMISRLAQILPLPPWPFEAGGRIAITSRDITLIGASGTAAEHRVAADGRIAFSADGPVRLEVEGSGPSLEAVLQGLGYAIIPAAAPYEVEGSVEFVGERVTVAARRARLGPTQASGSVSIPDLDAPSSLVIDIGNAETTDLSGALALAGVTLDLPPRMPATVEGQLRLDGDAIVFSKVRGTIQARHRTDGSAETDASDQTRPSAETVEEPIPFFVEGSVAGGDDYTRIDNLQLELGNIEARADGQVGRWNTIAGTELSVSVQSPSLDVVAAVLGRPLPGGAIAFDGHLIGTGNAVRIDRMKARVGRSNLSGDLTLTRGNPPRLTGQVDSTYLDFGLFQPAIEAPTVSTSEPDAPDQSRETPTEPSAGAPPSRQQPKLLFPDEPIELEALDKLDLDIAVRVDELSHFWQRGELRDLSAKVLLEGRDLSVTDFTAADATGATLEGNLAIRQEGQLSRVELEATGRQLRIGLAAAPGQEMATYPPTDLDARLTGAGGTYRQLAASLNGRIKVVQGEGRINNQSVDRLLSDVLYELFKALNPAAKSESATTLSCGVFIAEITDGVATLPSIVAQTDRLNIVSAGTVDLNTERIDLDFTTRPRKGLGLSASIVTNPWIKLGGTLARPAITVNPAGATISTSAAVATGGLSILAQGIWDRLLGTRDPCALALERDTRRRDGGSVQQPDQSRPMPGGNRTTPPTFD